VPRLYDSRKRILVTGGAGFVGQKFLQDVLHDWNLPAAPERREVLANRVPARSRARAATPGRAGLPAPHRGLAHNGTEGWCGRDTGARIQQALKGQSRAAGHKPLTPALRYVSHPHHDKSSHSEAPGATPPPTLAPAPGHTRRHDKKPVPSTDHMHGPPGAVRSLCPPNAPSSLDQRLSNLEEKLAQALDFSSVDARPCRHR